MKCLGLERAVSGETGTFQGENGMTPEKTVWLAKKSRILSGNRVDWRKIGLSPEKSGWIRERRGGLWRNRAVQA
jgi:hypothetical protein